MAKAHEQWTVLPHGPIETHAPNLWRVSGRLEKAPIERVMVVAKRADGRLVIHGAMALDDASMKQLESLGEVGFVLVPNGFHRLDAKVFRDRYPKATFLGPRGSRRKIEEVVKLDGVYEDFPEDEWVRLETLDGVAKIEGVVVVRSGDETSLIFNDAVFNMPHRKGLSGLFLRYVTQSSGGPRISRLSRMLMIKDGQALAAHMRRLAALPNLKRIFVAHQDTITEEPAQTLVRVAATI